MSRTSRLEDSTDFIEAVGNTLTVDLWKNMLYTPRTTYSPLELISDDATRIARYEALPDIGRDLLIMLYGDLDNYLNVGYTVPYNSLEEVIFGIIGIMDDHSLVNALGYRYGIVVGYVGPNETASELFIETLMSVIYNLNGRSVDELLDMNYPDYVVYASRTGIVDNASQDDYNNRLVDYTIHLLDM